MRKLQEWNGWFPDLIPSRSRPFASLYSQRTRGQEWRREGDAVFSNLNKKSSLDWDEIDKNRTLIIDYDVLLNTTANPDPNPIINLFSILHHCSLRDLAQNFGTFNELNETHSNASIMKKFSPFSLIITSLEIKVHNLLRYNLMFRTLYVHTAMYFKRKSWNLNFQDSTHRNFSLNRSRF